MDTHPYFGGGNAVVDTCERCGLIWLDAGELPIIERYIPHVRQIEAPLILAHDSSRERHLEDERALEGLGEVALDYLLELPWGLG
jgi:Zn-finger nucleic acid-binding protein